MPSRAVRVEVVYALPGREDAVAVVLRPGATVRDAVLASGIAQRHPQIDLAGCKLGIFGKAVTPEARVADGDRVEIYRALAMDPKEARRRRVKRKL